MMNGIIVTLNSRQVEYSQPKKQWGAWSSEYSWSIDKFAKLSNDDYPDCVCYGDVKSGSHAYVVWAVWSTGDSFGYSTNGSAEAIAAFSDPSHAFLLSNKLKEFTTENRKSYRYDPVEFQIGDYSVKIGMIPWIGYFESLSEINVDEVTLVG